MTTKQHDNMVCANYIILLYIAGHKMTRQIQEFLLNIDRCKCVHLHYSGCLQQQGRPAFTNVRWVTRVSGRQLYHVRNLKSLYCQWVCMSWKIQSGTYLGAKTFHTIRCLLRIAAAQTEAKTCEDITDTEWSDVILIHVQRWNWTKEIKQFLKNRLSH